MYDINNAAWAAVLFRMTKSRLAADGIKASTLHKIEKAIALCDKAFTIDGKTPMEAMELMIQVKYEVEEQRGTLQDLN